MVETGRLPESACDNLEAGAVWVVANRYNLKALPEKPSSLLMWEKDGKQKLAITGKQIFLWEIE